jgi:hypothetical protein
LRRTAASGVAWAARRNCREFLRETEVEHAVGLVENQRLHLLELDGVLAEKVEQAAGGGDENIDATRRRIICGLMLTPP